MAVTALQLSARRCAFAAQSHEKLAGELAVVVSFREERERSLEIMLCRGHLAERHQHPCSLEQRDGDECCAVRVIDRAGENDKRLRAATHAPEPRTAQRRHIVALICHWAD